VLPDILGLLCGLTTVLDHAAHGSQRRSTGAYLYLPPGRDSQGDTQLRHTATMDDMDGGLGRTNGSPAPEPAAEPYAVDWPDPADELHFCCICGALLGFDREDEINGEGPGRDVCGDCNRTKNFETMVGNE
jgi:hypothetical protein